MDILLQLEQNIFDKKSLYRFLSQELLAAVQQNFEDQTAGLQGPQWLSTKYPKQGKILQDSGALLRSIHPKYSSEEASVGTNLKYAATHQLGLTIQYSAPTKIFTHAVCKILKEQLDSKSQH